MNVDTGITLKNTNPYSKKYFPKKLILENGYAPIVARKVTRVAVETAMSKLFNIQRNGRPEKALLKFSIVTLVGIPTVELAAVSTEARKSQLKGISVNINISIKIIWIAIVSGYLIHLHPF